MSRPQPDAPGTESRKQPSTTSGMPSFEKLDSKEKAAALAEASRIIQANQEALGQQPTEN